MAAQTRATEQKAERLTQLEDYRAQRLVYEELNHVRQGASFSHAYLITGMAGVGKSALARLMTRMHMCTGDVKPCGSCKACRQVEAGTHPDVLELRVGEPLSPKEQKGKSVIPVGDIRYLRERLGLNSFEGGHRAVIIDQADKMQGEAQNALLKTLEEPPSGCMLLLITEQADSLLGTIRSRCRALPLSAWPDEVIRTALVREGVGQARANAAVSAAGGSIGRALQLSADEGYWAAQEELIRDLFGIAARSDIPTTAAKYAYSSASDRQSKRLALLRDIDEKLRLLMLIAGRQRPAEEIQGYPAAWQRMAQEAAPGAFVPLFDAVTLARRRLMNNVNWQAALEQLLLSLMEAKSRWAT